MGEPQTGAPIIMVVGAEGDLAERLEGAGYQSVMVASGEQAVTAFAPVVDAVLVSGGLPGMDAVETSRTLKKAAGHAFLPVLVIPDEFSIDDRVRVFTAGCDDYLPQPISFFEIDSRLRSLLDRRRQHAELAAANERLLEAQHKKKELAALMVHDLRNPLSALQGNIQLMVEEFGESSEFAQRVLGDCQELSRKALTMVNGILDVEELEAGLLQVGPSDVILDSFLRQVAKHHRVPIQVRKLELLFDVSESLSAEFDEELVARVVENLLDNSVRYAPYEGKVVVGAATEEDWLVIRVGNNGPPVPADDRPNIFKRFFRIEARRAGARANRGLGLYFCSLVAEAHGGTICVEQSDELPACFALRLPLAQRASPS